jgi:hypothetical protein
MPQWDQHSLRPHMHVYSSDNKDLGHIAHVYEDSFEIKKGLLSADRYIPYDAVASVDNDDVRLALSADDITQNDEWKKRPDYEEDFYAARFSYFLPDPISSRSQSAASSLSLA